MRKNKQQEPFGARLCALVVSELMGISCESAAKLYVRGQTISPHWEELGEWLLAAAAESVCAPQSSPPAGPQIVRPELADEHAS